MSDWQPNRYDDIKSRHEAARILRDASDPHHHGDDEPKPPWYRNPWVWVSIIVSVLIALWLVAVFS